MKIRTLGADEKITEPGFYNIPLERHHNQPCDGVSVTSGVLRQMELETPADVWAFSRLNPNRWEREETDALRLGVAMALYVEGGPLRVKDGFKIHPEDKPRRPTKPQIKAYDEGRASDAAMASVEYWRQVDAAMHGYLDQAEFDLICTMGEILAADPAAAAVMGGVPEITMAWKDEITGIWVLSRPDTINFSGAVSDYKKMNSGGRPFTGYFVDRRIEDHGYHMQIALGCEGMERLMGEWPGVAGIVAQSDKAPHHVILREIDEEDLRIGQFQNRRALSRFHECMTSGYWPGPGEVVGRYNMNKSLRERLLEQMNTENTAP